MSDVLLGSYFGGLGDNLQFSTLPEEFSKQKGRDTYIVSETTFRNKKTKEVFDKHNVLVKYCTIPHDDRKNWCRLTIQPNITKEKFVKELLSV